MEQGNTPVEDYNILPLEMLGRYYTAHVAEHDSLKQQISSVEEERKEAMRLAAEPYEEILSDLQARILGELELMAPERLEQLFRDEALASSPIYRAAFELLLARYETDIPKFIFALTADSYPARIITDQLFGISRLEQSMEQSPGLPVFHFNLEWFEAVDSQAQWEGRNSSTGNWSKRLSGVLGFADTIEVAQKSVTLPEFLSPISQPVSIVLKINRAHHIKSEYDWGDLKAELTTVEQDKIDIIKPPPRFKPSNDRLIDWPASQTQNFSMLRKGPHEQMFQENDPRTFCVYGEEPVRQALSALQQDKSIPDDMKKVLQQLQ